MGFKKTVTSSGGTPGGAAGGDLGGTYPNPTVTDDSHTHTSSTVAAYFPGGTDVAIADGGTGASTAGNARSNLGLQSMSIQSASSVNISGGSITGITDLAIADGGTGGSTAFAARANLLVSQDKITNIAPTVNDDSSLNYEVGSRWTDTVSGLYYRAKSVAIGAAIWTALGGVSAFAPDAVEYPTVWLEYFSEVNSISSIESTVVESPSWSA